MSSPVIRWPRALAALVALAALAWTMDARAESVLRIVPQADLLSKIIRALLSRQPASIRHSTAKTHHWTLPTFLNSAHRFPLSESGEGSGGEVNPPHPSPGPMDRPATYR